MSMRWLEIIIGLWLIISPWLLGFRSISVMMWSNTLVGIILVIAGLWEKYGGGENSNTPSPEGDKK